jgi:hypothetical protein
MPQIALAMNAQAVGYGARAAALERPLHPEPHPWGGRCFAEDQFSAQRHIG